MQGSGCKSSECACKIITTEWNSNTGFSVHVDFHMIVRFFWVRLNSFNGVSEPAKTAISPLCDIFVVDESTRREAIDTPIVLGQDCVIDRLVHRTIPDDSLF